MVYTAGAPRPGSRAPVRAALLKCGRPHDIQAIVQDVDGHQLAEVVLRLQTDIPATLGPDASPGRYSVDVSVDGGHHQSAGLVATVPTEHHQSPVVSLITVSELLQ